VPSLLTCEEVVYSSSKHTTPTRTYLDTRDIYLTFTITHYLDLHTHTLLSYPEAIESTPSIIDVSE